MRYFLHLRYNGTRYSGWQKQPNAPSIQAEIENQLAKLARLPIPIVGCGRTDAGVHAEQYYAHFDIATSIDNLTYKLNKLLPADIHILDIIPVGPDAHARYDATRRSYMYRLSSTKEPFRKEWVYAYPYFHQLDTDAMQDAARLLLNYEDFFPFCKTGSDNTSTLCRLQQSEWHFFPERGEMEFHISANRFLRGMVRLIVGMCLNVGLEKLSLEEVKQALEHKRRLIRSHSVAPEGLSLTAIQYDNSLLTFP